MWKLALISLLTMLPANAFAFGDERSVVEDARDGTLEQAGLLESALDLSAQLPDTRRGEILLRFAEVSDSARHDADSSSSELARVQLFIKQLHEELFRGKFNADSDGVDEAFQTGRYNCVTSLILTLEFCRRQRISAKAMQSGNHVWLRLGDAAAGDVETTLLPVSEETKKGAVTISDAQLLSRLLYNQARRQHQSGDFEGASKKLEWCLLIDPTFGPADRNLRIVLENWMAAAEAQRQFAEAVAVSQRAITRFPNDENLRQNSIYLNETWAKWRKAEELGRSEAPVTH